MTGYYGRNYTVKYKICQWVCEAPKVWRAVTVVDDYEEYEEYDTYELASLLCEYIQLNNPGNKYSVVQVRYYEDDNE